MIPASAHRREGQRQRVVSRKHKKIFRNLLDHLRDLGNISGSFLHADDVFDFGQAAQRRGIDVDIGARRHVVQNNRERSRRRDGLEMVVEPFLRGLVVIRRDRQDSFRAHPFDFARHFDDVARIVAARAREDGHFAFGLFQRDGHDAQVLFVRQRGAFARRAARHQEINPACDLAAHQAPQRLFIERQILAGTE